MDSIAKWESEIENYRQTARRRRVEAEQQRQQLLKQAWKVAHKAADLLRERFSAQRVAAFGSLVHPGRFHTRSDVDLAAWDLDEQDYLRAVAAVTGSDREISLDLIPVEEAP